jgi:hypothetical protein
MYLYRSFLFLLSLFNFKAWGREKVWVNPALLGHGQSQYLRVGDKVFDNKGRLCIVVKQGKNAALKRYSHAKTQDTVAGWSLKKLGWVYGKYMQSRHFVLKRALLLGPTVKFKWMMNVLKARVLVYRFRKHVREHIEPYIRYPCKCLKYHVEALPYKDGSGCGYHWYKVRTWNLDNIVLWWFILIPLVVGQLLFIGGVL